MSARSLAERIAARIEDRGRLRAVPLGVVEDVLRLGITALTKIVPMATPACELDAIDFESCEGCGHLIDPDNQEGAAHDDEGIWLCNACVVEEVKP